MSFSRNLVMVGALFISGAVFGADLPNGAKATYDSLGTREWIVEFRSQGEPRVGEEVLQKNGPSGSPAFCRKSTPVVPNPPSTYECYSLLSSGSPAMAEYENSGNRGEEVRFLDSETGSPVLGVQWVEKQIGEGGEICVATAPVVPHPIFRYSCYANHGVGGAVSGGN